MSRSAPGVRVYSRRGCHLCELLIEELLPLVRHHLSVEICDIDTRDEWQQKFHARVPVVEYRGRVVCEHRVDRNAIERLLKSSPGPLQHEAK